MINIYWFDFADCETFICLQIRLISCDTYLECSPYSMVVSLEDLLAQEIDLKLTKNFDFKLISQTAVFDAHIQALIKDSNYNNIFKFFT